MLTRVLRIILVIVPEHPSDTYVFTMKMEILLEPASNKLLVGSNTLSWKPCQGDSLNLPDHRILSAFTKCCISLPAAAPLPVDTTDTPSSTTSDQDAPSTSTSPTTTETHDPIIQHGVEEQPQRNQNA
ncbi:hypothetical protein Tco_0983753 [Tanacetum coccineum]